ncbi:MAG: flagellar protein FlaG [Nitrospiria bacterium]
MSTIDPIPQAVIPLAGASPPSQSTHREKVPNAGQKLPPAVEHQEMEGTEKSEGSVEATREAIQSTVDRLNEYAVNLKRNLKFSIDEELDLPVIRVIDSETDQVIRQIPSEEVLSIARRTEMAASAILDVLA